MPNFRDRTVVELARNIKSLLGFVGLAKDEVPNPEQQAQAQARPRGRVRTWVEGENRRSTRTRRQPPTESEQQHVIDSFHELYYYSGFSGGTWLNTYWLGVPVLKCPLDLWVYQEVIFEVRPDLIVETGTASGGSALFMACMCDLVGNGKIITIDVEDALHRPQHERIRYLRGSSTAESIVEQIRSIVSDGIKVLVLLDSDHRKEHVLAELQIYSQFVTKGSYIIVEDTNINGHPVKPGFGPGPMEAVQDFLEGNEDFIMDDSKEKFYLSFNPKGYLQRVG